MLIRTDSRLFRVLLWAANPSYRIPKILPVSFDSVRIGADYTSFARLRIRW